MDQKRNTGQDCRKEAKNEILNEKGEFARKELETKAKIER